MTKRMENTVEMLLLLTLFYTLVLGAATVVRWAMYPVQVECINVSVEETSHVEPTRSLPQLERRISFSGAVFSGCHFVGDHLVCVKGIMINEHAFMTAIRIEMNGYLTELNDLYLA